MTLRGAIADVVKILPSSEEVVVRSPCRSAVGRTTAPGRYEAYLDVGSMQGRLDRQVYGSEIELAKTRPRPKRPHTLIVNHQMYPQFARAVVGNPPGVHAMRAVHLLSLSACALALGMPASAATFTFTADLSSAGEPVPTSSALGGAMVTFDDVANSVSVNVNWTGLLGSAPFGHIHCCTTVPGTGNSGVALGFNALANVATGNYTDTFTPANFAALLTGVADGKAYVNIHTPGPYQAGEIRGFLAPIPEPSTYAMMLAGLAAVGVLVRRRKLT